MEQSKVSSSLKVPRLEFLFQSFLLGQWPLYTSVFPSGLSGGNNIASQNAVGLPGDSVHRAGATAGGPWAMSSNVFCWAHSVYFNWISFWHEKSGISPKSQPFSFSVKIKLGHIELHSFNSSCKAERCCPLSQAHLSHLAKAPCFLLRNPQLSSFWYVTRLTLKVCPCAGPVAQWGSLLPRAGKMSPPSRRVGMAQHRLSTKESGGVSSLLGIKRTGSQDSNIQNFQIVTQAQWVHPDYSGGSSHSRGSFVTPPHTRWWAPWGWWPRLPTCCP